MALPKSNLPLSFAVNLDTKTDPWQVQAGNMLELKNYVFTKDKRIQKRNGYANITSLPSGANATYLTTFNGNLTAVGTSFFAYAEESMQWLEKGDFQPVQLRVQSVTRSSLAQTRPDIAVDANNVALCVFLDGGVSPEYKYQIIDNTSGQVLVGPITLPTNSTMARAMILGNYFVITFLITIAATPHLQFIAIPRNNLTNPTAAADLSVNVSSINAGYDAYSDQNNMYVMWDGDDGGGAVRATYLDSFLNQHNTFILPGFTVDLASINISPDTNIWMSWYDSGSTNIYTIETDAAFNILAPFAGAPVLLSTGDTIVELTSISKLDGLVSNNYVYSEVSNTYSFSSVRSDYINLQICDSTATPTAAAKIATSVGLASKAFIFNNDIFMLSAYNGTYQPSYFMIKGNVGCYNFVIAKLAYENGGGYYDSQVLPSVSMYGSTLYMAYLFKDLLASVNRTQGIANVNGIYSQTGVNLATFDLSSGNLISAEIGSNLHVAGGFVWMYDGAQSVEHNFHVFPEDILTTPSAAGGLMENQQYFYQVVYEWTDAQGNIHRSAPSVPMEATVPGAGNLGSVALDIPTLRLTYKTSVRICIYRWSVAQQNYYMVTSITSPTLNDTAVDSISYTDTQADASILGNLLIYTTGGIVENIAFPAAATLAIFKNRLIVLDAEDRNLIWYSKQVIEGVPVEPSDLFTEFISPTLGTQGSTGEIKTLAAMDDKLILSKANAFYYIVGNGPDNAGANNDFSEPVFITATVGTSNQQSVTSTPTGLMFKSDKGIWILDRALNSNYVGAPVEGFNNQAVTSTVNVPGTNQIRFCLDGNNALMYDYYYQRWGEFENIPSISSTLWKDLHTYLMDDGQIRQEQAGFYKDGSKPVLGSFLTSWMNLAGLQGYERAYYFYFLGQYYSPHKLQIQIAYDYNDSASQSTLISPTNAAGYYGDGSYYGDTSPYSGPGDREQWRIFLKRQRCQAFQIRVQEVYDPSFGVPAGAGVAFSGLNLVVGVKKGYKPIKAASSAG